MGEVEGVYYRQRIALLSRGGEVMKPGRELDALVAEKVFGCHVQRYSGHGGYFINNPMPTGIYQNTAPPSPMPGRL